MGRDLSSESTIVSYMGESLFRSTLKEAVIQSPRGVVYFSGRSDRGGGGRLFPDTLKLEDFPGVTGEPGSTSVGGDNDVRFVATSVGIIVASPRSQNVIRSAFIPWIVDSDPEERILGCGGGTEGRSRDLSKYRIWLLVGGLRGSFMEITSIYRLSADTFAIQKRVNFSVQIWPNATDIGGDFTNVFMVYSELIVFCPPEGGGCTFEMDAFVSKREPVNMSAIRTVRGPANGNLRLNGCGGGSNAAYILSFENETVYRLDPTTLEPQFSQRTSILSSAGSVGGD